MSACNKTTRPRLCAPGPFLLRCFIPVSVIYVWTSTLRKVENVAAAVAVTDLVSGMVTFGGLTAGRRRRTG